MTEPQDELHIIPDFDDDDADSAIDVPFRESLTSLRSSILAYQQENGRTYHAMSAGKYFLPNDDAEIERLDLQHHVMTLTIEGASCLCPKVNGAKSVLDLGTGTGIWAMEYADQHPDAQVIGVDLSPVQPDFVPPNCQFEIDDLEKEWTWSQPFDFIFSRMMTGSFADNEAIVDKVFRQLEPGGYFEAQDMALPLGCDDGTLEEKSDLWQWMLLVMEGMSRFGRPVSAAQQWKAMMEKAGFEDVVETVFKWPTNRWPRDKKYKELGTWSLANMDQALEPATLAPLTRALGWSKEEVLVLVSKARKVLRDTSVHAYWPIYIVYGRKPYSAAFVPQTVDFPNPVAAHAPLPSPTAIPPPATPSQPSGSPQSSAAFLPSTEIPSPTPVSATLRSPGVSTRPWELPSPHSSTANRPSATSTTSGASTRPWEATSRSPSAVSPLPSSNPDAPSSGMTTRSPSLALSEPPPTPPLPRVPSGYTPFPMSAYYSGVLPVPAKSPAQSPSATHTSTSTTRWFEGVTPPTNPPPVPPKPASLRRFGSSASATTSDNTAESLRRWDSKSSSKMTQSNAPGTSRGLPAPPTGD